MCWVLARLLYVFLKQQYFCLCGVEHMVVGLVVSGFIFPLFLAAGALVPLYQVLIDPSKDRL